MAKKSKLLSALDRYQGKDYKLERQKVLQKKAEKKKREKQAAQSDIEGEQVSGDAPVFEEEEGNGIWSGSDRDGKESAQEEIPAPDPVSNGVKVKKLPRRSKIKEVDGDAAKLSLRLSDASPAVSSQASDAEDGAEDLPLSDIESLASDEREDIVPHQRLTINNTTALLKAHKSIALPSSLPFSVHQSITSAAQISIPDINDDLNRELVFYKQCLDAAVEARSFLDKEKVPFTRPTDYFAEMVKSDEHMGKIKDKMTEEAAGKRAAAEARKQRDLKKFGKQVQVAKLQERDRAKRTTLEKINILKRKRKDTDTGVPTEEDLFDVALDNETKDSRPDRRSASNSKTKTPKARNTKKKH